MGRLPVRLKCMLPQTAVFLPREFTQASCSVPASLVLGLFPLVKKNLWIVFFEKKVYFFQGTNPIRNHFFSLISFPPRDQQKSAPVSRRRIGACCSDPDAR